MFDRRDKNTDNQTTDKQLGDTWTLFLRAFFLLKIGQFSTQFQL